MGTKDQRFSQSTCARQHDMGMLLVVCVACSRLQARMRSLMGAMAVPVLTVSDASQRPIKIKV